MKRQVILLPIIGLIVYLQSCSTPAGHTGVSMDIKESKKRDVFVKEYTVVPNPYKINDSMQITVKEAWLEDHWRYGKQESETFERDGYQICVNSIKEDVGNYNAVSWCIGIDFEKNLRSSSNSSLMGDFKMLPGDTIEYIVQKGDNLSVYDTVGRVILGKFVLVAKKE
jgi:hypothetical protein